VPEELVGQTIGTGGSNLRELQDRSGCHIAFVQARYYDEHAPEGKRLARIKGPPEKVIEAERLLIEKVQEVQQIHRLKNMSRQTWGAGSGSMSMGEGMDHLGVGGGSMPMSGSTGNLGATAWSHWVHNDMGDSMQAAQRWAEEPQMAEQMWGGWNEDPTAGWHPDFAMGWPTHYPGMQAVGTSAAASELTSYGWPNKQPALTDAGWDSSARAAAAREPVPPGPVRLSGSAEPLATRTEASKSSSSSSNNNKVSSSAPHQDTVADSQASEGARAPAMESGGMDSFGASLDVMEAWAGKGKPGMPCHYQTRGMGATVPGVEPDDYKMTYCKFWDSGRCSKGALCTFAHGIDELRGGLTPKNLWIMEEAQKMMMDMDPRGPQGPEEALPKDSVPAAFRTAAFQQRLQTSAKVPMRTLQWP